MIRIPCLQHVACEGPGLLAGAFEEQGIVLDPVLLYEKHPVPPEPRDGLVVLGGPMGVYDLPTVFPTAGEEIRLIRATLDRGKPVLGICLGSQLLAKACDARVYPGEKGPEVGWFPVRSAPAASQDAVFSSLPSELTVFHWHGDTFDLPPGSVHLASSGAYPHQAFRVGSNAYGLQFHIEVTAGMVKEWTEVYAKELTTGGGKIPPGPVLEGLEEKALELEPHARTILSRLASLFKAF